MDERFYLAKFKKIAEQLNPSVLQNEGLEVAVGLYLDSVFLKLFKKSWASDPQNPLTAESRLFFSIWLNDDAVKQSIVFYNIHALKLRKFKGYRIESRKFAENFRLRFKIYENLWPNVSTNFGPLTLMQGKVKLSESSLEQELLHLCHLFIQLNPLIDDTLQLFKV